jgi:hypothetical protein
MPKLKVSKKIQRATEFKCFKLEILVCLFLLDKLSSITLIIQAAAVDI